MGTSIKLRPVVAKSGKTYYYLKAYVYVNGRIFTMSFLPHEMDKAQIYCEGILKQYG